jgi:hypothetical protein
MSAPSLSSGSVLTRDALHARFLTILPRIELHGQVVFRGVRCPLRKDDHLAEMVALAWQWFVRLAWRGKDATRFPAVLASYAARAVKKGRRLCGQEKGQDVLSPRAQQRRGFAVCPLPQLSTLSGHRLSEALLAHTQSPVPEQVCFRCDFPAWLASLSPRNRQIAQDLALGHQTQHLAQLYGLTEARISQLRREFHRDWRRFTGDSTRPA